MPQNNFTSSWCLKIVVSPNLADDLTFEDGIRLCEEVNAKVSLFENSYELDKCYEKVPNDRKNGLSVRVDGVRKEKCKTTDAIKSDPECYRGNTFQMTNSGSDPTYIFSRFGPIDPNFLYAGTEKAENCLGLVDNKELFDVACIKYVNVFKGILCGKAPKY
ncbi:unnamed protein product [Caenorhabditis angaria]|uniref:C-type lectin domain-containing protein n=1 Tax=Caenorhabditis angaria TaxID=860376 RepID=A0A9P1N2M6_9PELO|nr:unnamed protein product [Caenorhabditis angaria]